MIRQTPTVLAALLLVLATIACLAACGGNPSAPPDDTSATTVPEVTTLHEAPDATTAVTEASEPATDPATEEVTSSAPEISVVKKAVISGGGAGSKTYKAAFSLIEKKNPNVIVLCTAGRDTVSNINSYVSTMRSYSRNVEAIALSTTLYDPAELRAKIVGADLIIVGGGQSEYMYSTWEKFDVDKYLIEAYNSGVVCIGGSAGGMCWTYAAWNDFYELPDSVYKWFYGLDVINIYYGPHFSNSALWAGFDQAILGLKEPKYNVGYAMENGTALVFIDGQIVKSIREAGTEHIYEYKFNGTSWAKAEFAYTD
ncbi:MAG: Type 1 glutamine amidotransferase-like domain-containing protein [Clostridia bacterium]|nr:Type 1 glutamine amidotransferase-like domain-containing protein [Clostridia bacterium]